MSCFLVTQNDGQPTACVFGAVAVVVSFYTSNYIAGYAGVQAAIGTFQNINVPVRHGSLVVVEVLVAAPLFAMRLTGLTLNGGMAIGQLQ